MSSIEKIALALAATGLSARDIESELERSGRDGFQSLIANVLELRRVATSRELEETSMPHRPIRSLRGGTDAAVMIDRMLRQEAGLSAAAAAKLLADEMNRRSRGDTLNIPPYTKSSFVDWVDRLLRAAPASEVLHLAARIRNEKVHSGDGSPWELRTARDVSK